MSSTPGGCGHFQALRAMTASSIPQMCATVQQSQAGAGMSACSGQDRCSAPPLCTTQAASARHTCTYWPWTQATRPSLLTGPATGTRSNARKCLPGQSSGLQCQITFIDEVGGSATERMRRPPIPPASFLGLSPGSSLLTLSLSLQHPCCNASLPCLRRHWGRNQGCSHISAPPGSFCITRRHSKCSFEGFLKSKPRLSLLKEMKPHDSCYSAGPGRRGRQDSKVAALCHLDMTEVPR